MKARRGKPPLAPVKPDRLAYQSNELLLTSNRRINGINRSLPCIHGLPAEKIKTQRHDFVFHADKSTRKIRFGQDFCLTLRCFSTLAGFSVFDARPVTRYTTPTADSPH